MVSILQLRVRMLCTKLILHKSSGYLTQDKRYRTLDWTSEAKAIQFQCKRYRIPDLEAIQAVRYRSSRSAVSEALYKVFTQELRTKGTGHWTGQRQKATQFQCKMI